jgi:hypothetical protein
MWHYIAVDMMGDILFLEEGEQYDESYGYINRGYPPFYSVGGPLDVITAGMEHLQKMEKMHIGFISMN